MCQCEIPKQPGQALNDDSISGTVSTVLWLAILGGVAYWIWKK